MAIEGFTQKAYWFESEEMDLVYESLQFELERLDKIDSTNHVEILKNRTRALRVHELMDKLSGVNND